ncbi:MAG: aminoacyl-tRNA hydrolase [Gammaproteobacteria bacterium]|nr:aminoacyl-tRNA hydrolase [Gammaproteobacteria bacterium]
MTVPSTIKLVVGLGNPGQQYEQNRHNTGFWFVDLLARRYSGNFKVESKFHGSVCRIRIDGSECWLLKPSTYMNRSGRSVSSLANYYKIDLSQMLVAHDELDLAAGEVRLKLGGGHAGHNGLRDIISAMGGREFWRLRIGIDHPGERDQVVSYVLGNPSRDDAMAIESRLESATDKFPRILAGKSQLVMNELHGES